jgi:hypothetical protein
MSFSKSAAIRTHTDRQSFEEEALSS